MKEIAVPAGGRGPDSRGMQGWSRKVTLLRGGGVVASLAMWQLEPHLNISPLLGQCSVNLFSGTRYFKKYS